MRILIVDDDPSSLIMLQSALVKAGHEVVTAGNGRQALEILDHSTIRLVISDWEMPELDGLELCRRIRSRDLCGYIYTILLTARDGSQDTVKGLSEGADDFMSKPFDPDEMTVRIRIAERILSLETRGLTIFALAKLAESRDPETGAHLERVRNYSRLIAQHLATQDKFKSRVDAGFVHLIFQTSPLHDIGKIAIPDCVLLKPSRLSDREFAIMKTHASIGAETLEASIREHPEAQFLLMARDIAAAHHERFDGSGYPNGLSGADIPLAARIVALADVYDALTSKRVYKGAFGHDVARSMIVEGSGTQFDPDIVSAFLHQEEQFITVQQRYSDGREEAA